jgi:hypothetical protein
MLLLCAYIALGATSRLTRRQAGYAAAAATAVVIAIAMLGYSRGTPRDKYIPNLDSAVYATGRPPPSYAVPPNSEDVTGVKPANWFSTNHTPLVNNGGGG